MAYRSGSGTAASSSSNTIQNLTVAVPVGNQVGDLIIVGALELNDNETLVMNTSGFTAGAQHQSTGPNYGPQGSYAWWWKIVSGSADTGTYSVQFPSYLDNFGEALIAAAFTGRSGISAAGTYTDSSGGASPHNLALTGLTAAAGDDLFYFAGFKNGSSAPAFADINSYTGLPAPTPFNSVANGGANSAMYGGYKENVSAGATGTQTPVTWTLSGAGTDNEGIVIALAASGGGSSVSVTPSVGAVAFSGNTAAATPATNMVIKPVTARRGLWVPKRKIFLPTLKRAA